MRLYFNLKYKSNKAPVPENFNADYIQFEHNGKIYVFDLSGWTEWDYSRESNDEYIVTGRSTELELIKVIENGEETAFLPLNPEPEIEQCLISGVADVEVGIFIDETFPFNYDVTFEINGKQFNYKKEEKKC